MRRSIYSPFSPPIHPFTFINISIPQTLFPSPSPSHFPRHRHRHLHFRKLPHCTPITSPPFPIWRWSVGVLGAREGASKQGLIIEQRREPALQASCASGGGKNNWCVGFGHGIPVVCEKKLGVGAGDSQQVSVGV